MRPFRRTVALSLVIGAALAACASPPLPGVSVRSVSTDVGLGVLLPEVETPEPVEFPDLPDFPFKGFDFRPPEPFDRCPTAPLLDFPIPVTTSVRPGVRPPEGVYQWVHEVTITDAERAKEFLPPGVAVPEDEVFRFFGSRNVRAVIDAADDAALGAVDQSAKRGSFQFTEDITPGLFPNAGALTRGDIYRVHPRSPLDSDVSTGDSGEGILDVLTAWVEVSQTNQVTSWLMVYSPPPLLITFPIGPGQRVRWATGGQPVNAALLGLVPTTGLPDPSQIDPEKLQELGENAFGPKYSFSYEGVVGAPMDFDACGDMVQAWPVEGILTIGVEGQTFKIDYDYGIAPQFGGLIIYERLAFPATEPAFRVKTPRVEELDELKPESRPFFEIVAFMGQENPTES